MTKSIKTQAEKVDSIFDHFKNGKLESRDISKGDLSFSMRYDHEFGSFTGTVMQKKGEEYEMIYTCMEEAGTKWAVLPYPELMELRDYLAKVWAEEIKQWMTASKQTLNDFDTSTKFHMDS